MLIGPSGCGKTTTMRMINRMIEPDGGTHPRRRAATSSRVDPVALRRSIGYVIQQVGLFPHLSIADNVATVPRLLGWDDARIAERVDELLALVGMDPRSYRDRYPRELSGGQQQRVGVARALAADPPVMLMDEPFGALDPITRARLQDEFLRILRACGRRSCSSRTTSTRRSRWAIASRSCATARSCSTTRPRRILARPADAFVDAFVGADRALKRLVPHRRAVERWTPCPRRCPRIRSQPQTSLQAMRSALMLAAGVDALAVVDARGVPVGALTLAHIRSHTHAERPDA